MFAVLYTYPEDKYLYPAFINNEGVLCICQIDTAEENGKVERIHVTSHPFAVFQHTEEEKIQQKALFDELSETIIKQEFGYTVNPTTVNLAAGQRKVLLHHVEELPLHGTAVIDVAYVNGAFTFTSELTKPEGVPEAFNISSKDLQYLINGIDQYIANLSPLPPRPQRPR